MKRLTFLLTLLLLLPTMLLAEGAPRLFLIGDSTCANKRLDKENPERGWGQLLPTLLSEEVIVENHAVNGRSTKSFRDEGRWQVVYSRLQEGDYLLIEFGHNDQKINDTTRYSSPSAYAENLRCYVREAREKGAIPLLLTPIVRRNFVDGVLTDTHAPYADTMRMVAQEMGVPLLDMERKTQAWVAALGEEASKACFMWVEAGRCPLYPDGRADNTHLNVRGARAVARMVANALREQVPALASYFCDYDWVVAKDGSGDFFTVGEAVEAIPDFGRDTTRLLICEGEYREKIAIPATKRLVAMEGRGKVTIWWDDYADRIGATGHRLGTSGSSTLYFGGEGWRVRNITFENRAGRVGQAVAVQCLASRLHFVGCRFLGNQDTLYLYASGNQDGQTVRENARMLFEGCYIEGTTDFIFGAASALFRNCEIRSKSNSYITAASTCRGQSCGFIFEGCRLTADEGVERCYLGRPWRDYAQTLFLNCEMGTHILPEGWHDWSKPHARKTAYYGEYRSTGAGATERGRVKWAHHLSAKEAEKAKKAFGEW